MRGGVTDLPRFRADLERRAHELAQLLLRLMASRGHQLHAIGADEERAVVPIERQYGAIRRARLAESFVGLHCVRSSRVSVVAMVEG